MVYDVCQNTTMTYTCSGLATFSVANAFFGRLDSTVCPLQPIATTSCYLDITSYVTTL
jgi:hypothetical protein